MTLRPNYARAWFKPFVWVFGLTVVVNGVIPEFQGKHVHISDVLSLAAFLGAIAGVFVAVVFTPREMSWSEESFRIRTMFPSSGEFEWRQLEAWSPYGNGVFLLKFEGQQAYQIAPGGFRSEDWKGFTLMIKQRFPKKKTMLWIGVKPIRFGKDK